MVRYKAICILVVVLSFILPQNSFGAPNGEVVAYGIWKSSSKEKEIADASVPGGKRISISKVSVSEQTDQIPATRGIRFGFEYILSGFPENTSVEIRKVTQYPLIKFPDGKELTGHDRNMKYKSDKDGKVTGFAGFAFDEEYWIVPGQWTFQLWYKDENLLEQTFTVYTP